MTLQHTREPQPKHQYEAQELIYLHVYDWHRKTVTVQPGRILAPIEVEGSPSTQYLIKVLNPYFIMLECRDEHLIARSPDGFTNVWPPYLVPDPPDMSPDPFH